MRKKMLFSVFLMGGLMCVLANAFALEIGQQEVNITLTDAYVSRYIFRGQDLFGDNDGSHQLSIDIAFPGLIAGTDVSLNIWSALPLSGGHEDAEEVDYTLAFARDLGESFSASAGYTYFDFPNTTSTALDVSEFWTSLTLNKIPLLPMDVSATVFVAYDIETQSGGLDEGVYFSWGFDTEIPLPEIALFQEGQTLGIGVVNWGNDGVAGLEASSLYATDILLSTSYAVGDFSITPSINYSIGHIEAINSGNDELWAGVEISYAL